MPHDPPPPLTPARRAIEMTRRDPSTDDHGLTDADRRDVSAICARIGVAVKAVEPLPSGRNVVCRLRCGDGRRRVLKLARTDDGHPHQHPIVREPRVDRMLLQHGLPAPRVERADLDGRLVGRPWFVAADAGRRTAADPAGMNPVGRRELFARVGRLLARVHSIAFDRPADFRGDALAEAGFLRSPLEDWHRRSWDRAARLRIVPGGGLPTDDYAPASFALCHGDFNPSQCVRRGPKVTAIVDWESAHVGDPAYDLAAFEVTLRVQVPRHLAEAALDGYRQVRPLDGDEAARYRPVRAAHAAALAVLYHQQGRGGPMRAARAVALAELGDVPAATLTAA